MVRKEGKRKKGGDGMNKQIFWEYIIKLEKALKPLASKKDERMGKFEIYYERLKDADEYLLGKAVKILQETYSYKSFPLISEIFSAIGTARDSLIVQNDPGSECGHCQGTGWVVRDCIDRFGRENNIAAPCKYCGVGRAVKKACMIKDKDIKRKHYRDKLKKTAKELTENLPDNFLS